MVSLAAPPTNVSPPAGMPLDEQYAYFMALLFERDRKLAIDAVKEIGERLAEDFITGLKALEKSSGFVRPGPVERLTWYRQKPPELWDEQRAKFPNDWAEDWEDWQKLRTRALNGDFGLQEQAAETLWTAQQGLRVME